MTDTARASGRSPDRILIGILSIVVGMILFGVQDGMMKVLLNDYTVWMLLAVRGYVAVVVLVPLICYLGPPHRLLTPLWPIHVLRGFLFAIGFSSMYAAVPLMSLAKVMTIFFTGPLLITLFAVIFLGEKIGRYRIAALLVGISGIVVAIDPTVGGFDWAVLFPLATAFFYAIQQTLSRWMGDRETSMTLGLYSLGSASVFVMIMGYGLNYFLDMGPDFHHMRWEVWLPPLEESGILLFLGFNGMVAMLLLWRAYQIAPAGAIAPFDYTYLIWAVLIGYFFFDEVPTTNTIVGMLLIASSGLYIGFREIQQVKRKKSMAPTAEVILAPGIPTTDPVMLIDTKDRDA